MMSFCLIAAMTLEETERVRSASEACAAMSPSREAIYFGPP